MSIEVIRAAMQAAISTDVPIRPAIARAPINASTPPLSECRHKERSFRSEAPFHEFYAVGSAVPSDQ